MTQKHIPKAHPARVVAQGAPVISAGGRGPLSGPLFGSYSLCLRGEGCLRGLVSLGDLLKVVPP